MLPPDANLIITLHGTGASRPSLAAPGYPTTKGLPVDGKRLAGPQQKAYRSPTPSARRVRADATPPPLTRRTWVIGPQHQAPLRFAPPPARTGPARTEPVGDQPPNTMPPQSPTLPTAHPDLRGDGRGGPIPLAPTHLTFHPRPETHIKRRYNNDAQQPPPPLLTRGGGCCASFLFV